MNIVTVIEQEIPVVEAVLPSIETVIGNIATEIPVVAQTPQLTFKIAGHTYTFTGVFNKVS